VSVTCDYCGNGAQLVDGTAIYPHRSDLYFLKFWTCQPCAAYVGCHRGTQKPLGRLANAELRQAKQDAHAAFDQLWRFHTFGQQPESYQAMTRTEAYKWLAKELGIEFDKCHIGMFDVETCQKVVEAVNRRAFR